MKSPEARAWLDAVPKTEALTMSPTEFRTAFGISCLSRIRSCWPMRLVPVVKMSTFWSFTRKSVDSMATSLTARTISSCSCGQSVRVEVTGIFNNVDPANHQRMDLVIYDPGRPNLLYDVVVTNPVTAEVMRSNTTNRRAAWTQQRTKEGRYRAVATEAGMLLHGLAIEVYGSWGDDFSHMFNHFITPTINRKKREKTSL